MALRGPTPSPQVGSFTGRIYPDGTPPEWRQRQTPGATTGQPTRTDQDPGGQPLVYDDAPTGTLTLGGISTDARIATATTVGTIALTGQSTDALARSATVQGTVALTGTSQNSKTHSDSPAATLPIHGQATTAQTHNDTAHGTITLTGDNTVSIAYSTAPAGTASLTGAAVESHEQQPVVALTFRPPGVHVTRRRSPKGWNE